jgi:Di-haem oxidoreductase, putative peroxidase
VAMTGRSNWALAGTLLSAVVLSAAPLRGLCTTKATSAPLPFFDRRKLAPVVQAQASIALRDDAFRRERRFESAASGAKVLESLMVSAHADAWEARLSEVFEVGHSLFGHTFTLAEGFGGKDLPRIRRFHLGRRGGPDARTCVSCHFRGGVAGGGEASDNGYFEGDGETQESCFARNPKSLVGAGIIQLVAEQLSRDLASARQAIIARARRSTRPVREELKVQGITFGFLIVHPDGKVETTDVRGVDGDLIVRPFGWKGLFSNLRDAVEEALLVHHGMESEWLEKNAPRERVGAFGGPDPDGDGVSREISENQVAALTLYLAMQEVPVTLIPSGPNELAQYARGRVQFYELGCASCHVPKLTLTSTRYRLESRGFGIPMVEFDLGTQGAEPRLSTNNEVYLYSDLRRHDMGSDLADDRAQSGVAARQFVTPPLWGVARSRPYLHDGRAPDIETAIALHGGEAQTARDRYMSLDDENRAPVRIFLSSLTRAKRLITR